MLIMRFIYNLLLFCFSYRKKNKKCDKIIKAEIVVDINKTELNSI